MSIATTPTTYLSANSTAAANTAAINTALTAAAAAGGGTVYLAAGTWHHTGIVFPAGGYVELRGVARDATVLYNDSTSAVSITVAGVGSSTNPARPYAVGWALRNLTVTTGAIRSGQIGLSLTLAAQFEVSNVTVTNHDTGVLIVSCWESLFSHIVVSNAGAYGYRFMDGYAGSTPLTFVDCHATTISGTGVIVENSVNALTWIGGDNLGTGTGWKILGSNTRLIKIDGVNFESNSGADIQIGNTSGTATYPGAVTITNSRHRRSSTTGTIAIDHQTGGPVTIIGSYFSNYTTAINQSNVTNPLHWYGLTFESVTNSIYAQPSSTQANITAGSGTVSVGGLSTIDASAGLASSNGISPGAAGGPKIWAYSGFGPWGALGLVGDFYFQGGGASGSRLYIKTASTTWTAIL